MYASATPMAMRLSGTPTDGKSNAATSATRATAYAIATTTAAA